MPVPSSHPSNSPFPLQAIGWRQRFQDQALCAPCVYDQDTAASQFLHGDSQPLPHYWLDFLGRVLEQMQASCTRRSRPGWIWIFVGAGPQGAKALVAANGSQRGAFHAIRSEERL